jgi:hypothetical protein
MRSSRRQSGQLINKFPHDRGQLHEMYTEGGRDSDKGKVVDEGLSGGCGSDHPQTASSMLSGSLGLESLVMTKHIHRIRVIQLINNRVANMRMKMVGASATKTIGVSVMNILVEMIEWGYKME